MKQLEEKILKEGKVLPGDILKVGSFLNQNIDSQLLVQMADEIARLFEGEGVTKIVTIEASGIAIAAAAGMAMGVPVLFAKKHKTSNVDGSIYSTVVHSFTHNEDYNVVVSSDYPAPRRRRAPGGRLLGQRRSPARPHGPVRSGGGRGGGRCHRHREVLHRCR